jgi:hypothetical protein
MGLADVQTHEKEHNMVDHRMSTCARMYKKGRQPRIQGWGVSQDAESC